MAFDDRPNALSTAFAVLTPLEMTTTAFAALTPLEMTTLRPCGGHSWEMPMALLRLAHTEGRGRK